MKHLLLILSFVFTTAFGFCEQFDTTIQRDSGSGDHHHHIDIPEREDPLGIGLDIEKDLTKHLGIAVEFRDDLRNQEKSLYGVLKIKL